MDGELAYWATLSGLTPAERYSIADHMVGAGVDPVPKAEFWSGQSGLVPVAAFSHADHKRVEIAGGAPDTTPPNVGTMVASGITQTQFTMTVSGASDAVALNAAPYAFSTDNGGSWSPYQASNAFTATGLTAGTAYTTRWRVRDAAGNVATSGPQVVNTQAAANYSQAVLADSPLGFWRFNETSGTALADSSGNARTMTLNGAATLAQPGAPVDGDSRAISFAANTQFGEIASAAWMDQTILSVEAWVKTTDTDGQIVGRDNGSTTRIFQLNVASGKARLIVWNASTVLQTALGAVTINDNQWHHLVGVADGTDLRLYVDGALDATIAQGPARTGAQALRVAVSGAGAEPFAGTVDDVAFYGTALSAARVAAHYAARVI